MKKKMTLRFILLALGGLALGGAITYLWWLAAYQWKAAPAPFPDVAFFTGFGMILIGILALTSAGEPPGPHLRSRGAGRTLPAVSLQQSRGQGSRGLQQGQRPPGPAGGGAAQRGPAGGLSGAPHRGSRGALLLDVKKRMAETPSFFCLPGWE